MLPLISLFLVTGFARATLGSWAAPGAFFALVWFGYMAISLALSPFDALEGGLWWMVLSITCLYLGNVIAISLSAPIRAPRTPQPTTIVLPYLPHIVGVSFFGAAMYVGFAPVYVLVDSSVKPPLLFQLFLACVYALPLFCGLLFGSTDRMALRLLGLVNFPLAAFMGVEHSGRSTLMMSIAFWTATYVSIQILRSGGKPRLISIGHGLSLLGGAVLIVVFLSLATISRYINASALIAADRAGGWGIIFAETDIDIIIRSLEGLQSSTVGSIASFTWWFEREWERPQWTIYYLASMFSGPLEQLGLMDRSLTAFDTTYFPDGTASNVYTLFRPLIAAFTLPGSLLFLLVMGLVSGRAYVRVANGNPGPIAVLFIMYACVAISGGVWFGYNSIDLAYVAVIAYLFWAKKHLRQQFVQPVQSRPFVRMIPRRAR